MDGGRHLADLVFAYQLGQDNREVAGRQSLEATGDLGKGRDQDPSGGKNQTRCQGNGGQQHGPYQDLAPDTQASGRFGIVGGGRLDLLGGLLHLFFKGGELIVEARQQAAGGGWIGIGDGDQARGGGDIGT